MQDMLHRLRHVCIFAWLLIVFLLFQSGDIDQIDRGYQAIDTRLNSIGACIHRRD